MKQTLAMFMIFVFMMGTSAAYADMYYSESFDKTAIGSTPAEFTVLERGHSIGVCEGTEHCCEIKVDMSKSQGSPYVDITKIGLEKAEDVVIENTFRLYNSDSLCENIVGIKNSKNELARIITIKNKTIYAGNGVSEVQKIEEGKFYDIQVVLHFKTGKYDVYSNGKMKAKNVSLGTYSVNDITTLRYMTMGLKEGCKNIFDFDNILVYEGSELLDDKEKEKLMKPQLSSAADMVAARERIKNVLFLYAESDKMFFEARLDTMSSKAFLQDETLYLPLKDVVKFGEKEELEKTTDTVIERNGIQYVSAEQLANVMGKQIQTDKTGFCMIGEEKDFFDWENDKDILTEIIGELNFVRPDGSEVSAEVIQNTAGVHPRMYAVKSDFEKLKLAVENEEEPISKWYAETKKNADALLETEPMPFTMQDNIRALNAIQTVITRLNQLGTAYYVSGDSQYAQRGIEEVLGFCSDELWPDWNPYQMLGLGEAAYAAALGYDLFYNDMTEEQRAFIREKIVEKAFQPYMDDINELTIQDASGRKNIPYQTEEDKLLRSTLFKPLTNNWAMIVNGGMTAAAVMICDEADTRASADEILTHSLREYEKGVSGFLPDGSWYEGTGYWDYAMRYVARCCRALENSCNTDYGLGTFPGLELTKEYILGIQGPGGTFNFSDAPEGYVSGNNSFWLAKKFNDFGFAKNIEKFMTRYAIKGGEEAQIDYASLPETEEETELALDYYWRDIETVTLRNSWDDSQANYIGMHGGKNSATHAQLDTGTIVLDAKGKRFISDLGSEDYNLNGAGGTGGYLLYRKNTQGHNLLCFNPTTDGYGQGLNSGSYITDFQSNRVDAFAVTDLSDVWSNYVTEYKRGIRLTNEKTAFILQDEFKLKENVEEMYWFIHTKGDISLGEDKKSASITIDNVELEVKLLTDNDGEFEIMDALPLENSPSAKISGQNQNILYKKLAFRFHKIKDGAFAVAFVPKYTGMPSTYEIPQYQPLGEWELQDDSEFVVSEKARVDMIYADGKPLKNFDPETASYEYFMPFGSDNVPNITADGDVRIYDSDAQNAVYIVAGTGASESVYSVKFTKTCAFEKPENANEITFRSLEASAEPQPQNNKDNVNDDNLDTRWSALAPCSLLYDLGEKKTIDYIGIAYYLGDERQAMVQVEVSEDGENWTTKFAGASSGRTKNLEYYDLSGAEGRYVKVSGLSSSNSWISITELRLYTKR